MMTDLEALKLAIDAAAEERERLDSTALFSDSERLEWVIETKASVTKAERMTTRQWPPTKDTLETVYQCEWWSKNGDLMMQSVDARHLTIREAIDAAMILENK